MSWKSIAVFLVPLVALIGCTSSSEPDIQPSGAALIAATAPPTRVAPTLAPTETSVPPTPTSAHATPTSGPSTPTPIPPTSIVVPTKTLITSSAFILEIEEVLPRYQENVTHAIAKSAEFANTLGFEFWSDQVTVYMIEGLDNLYQKYAERTGVSAETARQDWADGGFVSISGSGWLFVNVSHPWWENRATDRMQEKVIGHEFFHLVHGEISQLSLLGSSDYEVPAAGPRWLSEGTAEWFGWSVATLDSSLSYSYQDARYNRIASVALANPGTLDSMETWAGFNVPGSYDLGLLAGEFLGQPDPGKIVEYYRSLQRGIPWQETFNQVFGQSIEAFYQSWEAHRRAGFPTN